MGTLAHMGLLTFSAPCSSRLLHGNEEKVPEAQAGRVVCTGRRCFEKLPTLHLSWERLRPANKAELRVTDAWGALSSAGEWV